MQYLVPVVAVGPFLIAAYSDVRTRRIPNAEIAEFCSARERIGWLAVIKLGQHVEAPSFDPVHHAQAQQQPSRIPGLG